MGEVATESRVGNGGICDRATSSESSMPIEVIERIACAQLEHALDAHRKGLKVYKSLASLNEVIGTQYGDRVLFELLQNAHDAHAIGEKGEIVIRVVIGENGAGMLLVANKGRSFSSSNVEAIRNIGTSDKEIGEGIGNKGLGFRSVEALTDDVHIFSASPDRSSLKFDGYCFRFASTAEIAGILARLGADAAEAKEVSLDVPRYLVPIFVREQSDEVKRLAASGYATVICLPLISSREVALAEKQVATLLKPSVPVQLFLDRLVSLEVSVVRAGVDVERVVLTRKVESLAVDLPPDVTLQRITLNDGHQFLVARQTLSKESVISAVEKSIPAAPPLKRWLEWKGDAVVSVAVSMTKSAVSSSRLYNFLPMDEHAVAPIAGYIDAPFFADIDRRAIKSDLPLNRYLIEQAADTAAKVSLAIADGNVSIAQVAVVDLVAWSGLQLPTIVAAFKALGRPLAETSVWPAMSGKTARWASLKTLFAWPDVRTKHLTSARLESIAKADFFPSTVDKARLARVEAIASHLNLALDLQEKILCDWVESMADYLARQPRSSAKIWSEFYDDVVAVFSASDIDVGSLVGRKILIGSDNKLLVATADGLGDAPPVFARIVRSKRSQDAPNPPAAISRKFRFLKQDIEIREEVIQKFERAKLLRRYDPMEVLASLKGAFDRSATELQQREALIWSFRVWRSTGDKHAETVLRSADLNVPCQGGWFPARNALLSKSWSSLSRVLEGYLDEAAPLSEDCKGQRDRLLISYENWPRSRSDDRREDWARFLQILGIAEGLQPVPASIRRTATPSGYWNAFLRNGDEKQGFDANWRALAAKSAFGYPQTEYRLHGEAWRVPGQLEHEQLSSAAKEALSSLLVAYLKDHTDKHFTFSVSHWKGYQSVILPTPLQIFLREGAWPASSRWDQIVFARPSDSWSGTGSRQLPPRFIARFKCEPGVREELPAILFDQRIGLRNWADSAAAPGRLGSLASALMDLSAAERRDLREQMRRAWGDVAEHRMALPSSLPLVVERTGAFELIVGNVQDPPVVYVTSEPQGFAARSLADAGQAVMDVGEASASNIRDLINATGHYSARLADSGDVQLAVDGELFIPSHNDAMVVAGELSWLIDVAVIAHEQLGDPLELRTLSAEELDHRLRAIRLRRCDRFALTISGHEIQVSGGERTHAVPHARIPTLLVRGADAVDLKLLLEASQAITKLLGSRRNTLELLLGRLQRDGYVGGGVGPSEEMLARAIGRDISIVREHFAATKGGVKRRVYAVVPLLAHLKDRDASERLLDSYAQLGSALQIHAWLLHEIGADRIETILEVIGETDSQKTICSRLGFDFAAYGRTLADLGYPPMNDEADFRRMFSVYVSEIAPSVRDRIRRKFFSTWKSGEGLHDYVRCRKLEFIQFDPRWPQQLEQMDQAFVTSYVMRVMEVELAQDTSAIKLQPLETVVGANRKLLLSKYAGLMNLVRAWCRKNDAQQLSGAEVSDSQPMLAALDQAGLLDFEIYTSDQLPALLQRVGRWPDQMPRSDDLAVLGLVESDLRLEEQESRENRRKAELARRTILFADDRLDTGSPEFGHEFEALADSILAQGDDWLRNSKPVRLLQQEETQTTRGGSGGGAGSSGPGRHQPPEPIRNAMGIASEWLVRKYLFQRHPKEMSDACWVSTNRKFFCAGPAGNDSLGYDFHVLTARHEYFYEVKSAQDEGGEFELTARELEVAGSARDDRKRRYRILYVPFVFDPARWRVLTLPNPAGSATRDRYRVVRSGSVRYHFDLR